MFLLPLLLNCAFACIAAVHYEGTHSVQPKIDLQGNSKTLIASDTNVGDVDVTKKENPISYSQELHARLNDAIFSEAADGENTSGRRKLWYIVGGVVIIIVCAIIVGVLFCYFRRRGKSLRKSFEKHVAPEIGNIAASVTHTPVPQPLPVNAEEFLKAQKDLDSGQPKSVSPGHTGFSSSESVERSEDSESEEEEMTNMTVQPQIHLVNHTKVQSSEAHTEQVAPHEQAAAAVPIHSSPEPSIENSQELNAQIIREEEKIILDRLKEIPITDEVIFPIGNGDNRQSIFPESSTQAINDDKRYRDTEHIGSNPNFHSGPETKRNHDLRDPYSDTPLNPHKSEYDRNRRPIDYREEPNFGINSTDDRAEKRRIPGPLIGDSRDHRIYDKDQAPIGRENSRYSDNYDHSKYVSRIDSDRTQQDKNFQRNYRNYNNYINESEGIRKERVPDRRKQRDQDYSHDEVPMKRHYIDNHSRDYYDNRDLRRHREERRTGSESYNQSPTIFRREYSDHNFSSRSPQNVRGRPGSSGNPEYGRYSPPLVKRDSRYRKPFPRDVRHEKNSKLRDAKDPAYHSSGYDSPYEPYSNKPIKLSHVVPHPDYGFNDRRLDPNERILSRRSPGHSPSPPPIMSKVKKREFKGPYSIDDLDDMNNPYTVGKGKHNRRPLHENQRY